jgi:hypothetical protein
VAFRKLPASEAFWRPSNQMGVENSDLAADQLWFVVGAPLEAANTLEMSPELLAAIYPDGPKALPRELS